MEKTCYYFGHVVKPRKAEHGIPEHQTRHGKTRNAKAGILNLEW